MSGVSPSGQARSAMEVVGYPQGCGTEWLREVSAGCEGRGRASPSPSIVLTRFHTSLVCVQRLKFSRSREFVMVCFEGPQLLGLPSWKCHEKCEFGSPVLWWFCPSSWC